MIFSKQESFNTNEGFVLWSKVLKSNQYDFSDEPSFWSKSHYWISIDVIRVHSKFINHGKTLLHHFIQSLPYNIGIVLNVVPLDNDLPFTKLQNWYIKQGFQPINKNNISLFMLK